MLLFCKSCAAWAHSGSEEHLLFYFHLRCTKAVHARCIDFRVGLVSLEADYKHGFVLFVKSASKCRKITTSYIRKSFFIREAIPLLFPHLSHGRLHFGSIPQSCLNSQDWKHGVIFYCITAALKVVLFQHASVSIATGSRTQRTLLRRFI